MRKIVTALLILLPLMAFAVPQTLEPLMSESKKLRSSAEKKDLATRKKELASLMSKVRASIDEYKKSTPEEAGPEELKILRFSYCLEIPEGLKTPDKTSCEAARARLRANTLGDKADTGTLPPEGVESLAWIDLICK